jgi:hypothetical protein
MTQTATVNRVNGNGEYDLMAPGDREAMVEVASTRAAQEVQASMVIAKRFPRDEIAAFNRIMKACKRKSLAECALYAYPKGGQTVTGPSIRLAEALAQAWGNTDFGIIELEQRKGESSVMSYAWDLETNTRQTKIFTIPHKRHTRNGAYDLTDPREIYELTANQGARRLRACILGIIPGDVVDAAVAECEKTMAGNNAEPLIDRIRKMVGAFAEMSVDQAMIEKRVGHKVESLTEAEMVGLKKIFRSLKDNVADRSAFFEVETAQPTTNLDERLKQAAEKKQAKSAEDQTPIEMPEEEAPAQDESQAPPSAVPAHGRTDAAWINDIVLMHKPQGMTKKQAVDKFHAADVSSWDKLPADRQDAKYKLLMEDAFPWK